MKILKEIAFNVENGDSSAVKELTRSALSQNISPQRILNDGLTRGMDTIGVKFKNNEVFIPEVLIATRAMKAGMDIIKPLLIQERKMPKAKIVIGTVKGDLHDIGKNIVSMLLERGGYEIVDIGIDVPREKFLKTIKKENPDVVGMSALLTTTMSYMRDVIEGVEKARIRQNVKIIIGGAPVTPSFADEIRADGYASDGASAVDLVEKLLNK
jgi:5-methyltetrahydrofolate--homocysteine methyltransferase